MAWYLIPMPRAKTIFTLAYALWYQVQITHEIGMTGNRTFQKTENHSIKMDPSTLRPTVA